MEITKKSKLARFVYWYTKRQSWEDMPKSLCSYFWTAVFSIITLPVGVLFKDALNKLFEGDITDGNAISAPLKYLTGLVVTLCTYTLLCGIGYVFYYDIWIGLDGVPLPGLSIFNPFYLMITSILIIGLAIALAIIFGIKFLFFDKESPLREATTEFTNNTEIGQLTTDYAKSVKKKVCPIIKYKG